MDSMVNQPPRRARRISPTLADFRRRAAQTRLVITDCDGVLTDAGVYVATNGVIMRRFSVRDGMGVARLRAAGIETAILSQEETRDIRARAAKLQLRHVHLGAHDKRAVVATIRGATGYTLGQLAFIGDDVNDMELMSEISTKGITGAPADAMPEVGAAAQWRSSRPGGHGAFREFAEWILSLRAASKGRHS